MPCGSGTAGRRFSSQPGMTTAAKGRKSSWLSGTNATCSRWGWLGLYLPASMTWLAQWVNAACVQLGAALLACASSSGAAPVCQCRLCNTALPASSCASHCHWPVWCRMRRTSANHCCKGRGCVRAWRHCSTRQASACAVLMLTLPSMLPMAGFTPFFCAHFCQ